jgi:hypothetical protein
MPSIPLSSVAGKRYGRLTVLSDGEMIPITAASGRTTNVRFVVARCDCGNEKTFRLFNLKHNSSCGCVAPHETHGGTGTKLHKRWKDMFKRCNNKNAQNFGRYGQRGIAVCDEWKRFESFREWAMANGFDENLEIDRIDNNKGYSPDNCRFVDRKTNLRNRSNTRHLTAWGETRPLGEWLEDSRCCVTMHQLERRLDLKWPHDRAISEPLRAK